MGRRPGSLQLRVVGVALVLLPAAGPDPAHGAGIGRVAARLLGVLGILGILGLGRFTRMGWEGRFKKILPNEASVGYRGSVERVRLTSRSWAVCRAR